MVIEGVVIRGNQLGKKMNFPTANIAPKNNNYLMSNVNHYSSVWYSKTTYDGKEYPSISSIIYSKQGNPLVETHIFNFNKDIYGEVIEVDLITKLREFKEGTKRIIYKKKELKTQIEKDILAGKIYHGLMKKCTDCALCYYKDYGYSNWTVEGTETDCHLNLNPKLPMEKSYWDDNDTEYSEAISFAEKCNMYIEGDPEHYDVDGETERMSSEEIQQLIREGKINKILK